MLANQRGSFSPTIANLMAVRPIFVVGSPRSGTTMIGNYIGTAQSVLNAGEYRALDIAYGTLTSQLTGALAGLGAPDWETHPDPNLRAVPPHPPAFILPVAPSKGRPAFFDSPPPN